MPADPAVQRLEAPFHIAITEVVDPAPQFRGQYLDRPIDPLSSASAKHLLDRGLQTLQRFLCHFEPDVPLAFIHAVAKKTPVPGAVDRALAPVDAKFESLLKIVGQ